MNRIKILGLLLIMTMLSIPIFAQQKVWSLKQCIDTAFQKNIILKQVQLNNDINKINLEQAKENFYPNLNITDAPSLNFGKTLSSSGSYIDQNTTTNSFAITSNVTLYNGLQYQNIIKENKLIFDAGVQGVEKMKNDLTLNILADYLQVIASYEQVDIAVSQLKTDSIIADETKKWVDAGKLPELNLLQMLSQTAADKFAKVNAETQLEIAKVNLMQLMDIPVLSDFDVERPEINDGTLSVTSIPSTDIYKAAVGFLPEIKSAELSFNASRSAIDVAKSLYMPKLTLSAGIRTSGSTIAYQENYQTATIGYVESNPAFPVTGISGYSSSTNTYSNLWNQLSDNFNQAIGLNLTIPIFNNFQARNNTDIARINSTNAKLNEEAVRLTLRQSIEQAYTQLLEAAAQYNAAKEELETETLTYKNIEKKFEIGLSNATDYSVEKSNYLKAQQTFVQTKYNYLFKGKLIDFYLGKPVTM